MDSETASTVKVPWNKGKIVGQKAPLKLKDIWAIRIRLQLGHRTRELALFDLGLDSKLRACDLVRLRVRDICHGDRVSTRAIVMQQKTSLPVQFEITPPTRDAVTEWIKEAELANDDYLFPSRVHDSPHLGTRQYARILDSWIEEIGLDPTAYGTHTMRRTKASLIYRRTKKTYVLCNCFWDTPSWKAPFDTSELRSRMPWNFQSKRRFERTCRAGDLRQFWLPVTGHSQVTAPGPKALFDQKRTSGLIQMRQICPSRLWSGNGRS